MRKIEILGPGCLKCERATQVVQQAVEDAGLEAEVSHVTDVNAMAQRGVMMTPAVIIDGEIKLEGRVPQADEVRGWFAD